jgi:hypothetical protein
MQVPCKLNQRFHALPRRICTDAASVAAQKLCCDRGQRPTLGLLFLQKADLPRMRYLHTMLRGLNEIDRGSNGSFDSQG